MSYGGSAPSSSSSSTGSSSSSRRKPIPYKDLGKPINDMFTKGFPTTYKFELTTEAESGLKFVISAEKKQRESKDDSGGKTKHDYIFASFQPKIELKSKGINFNGTLDSEKIEGEVILSELLSTGLKTTFKVTSFDTSALEANGEIEYKNDVGAVSTGINFKDNKNKLNTSLLAVWNNFAFGGSIGYFLPIGASEGSLDNCSFAMNYSSSKFDITNLVNGKREKTEFKITTGAKVLYNHCPKTKFAADVNYDPAKSLKDGFTLKVLGQYQFDDKTSMKAKVDTTGNVGIAFSQKAYNNLTLTLATELNALKVEDHKVGFSLVFAP